MRNRVTKQNKDGWMEVDREAFWVLNQRGSWTGLTIAKLTDEWATPFKPETFHIRYYPRDGSNRDYDIGDASCLEEAKSLAKKY